MLKLEDRIGYSYSARSYHTCQLSFRRRRSSFWTWRALAGVPSSCLTGVLGRPRRAGTASLWWSRQCRERPRPRSCLLLCSHEVFEKLPGSGASRHVASTSWPHQGGHVQAGLHRQQPASAQAVARTCHFKMRLCPFLTLTLTLQTPGAASWLVRFTDAASAAEASPLGGCCVEICGLTSGSARCGADPFHAVGRCTRSLQQGPHLGGHPPNRDPAAAGSVWWLSDGLRSHAAWQVTWAVPTRLQFEEPQPTEFGEASPVHDRFFGRLHYCIECYPGGCKRWNEVRLVLVSEHGSELQIEVLMSTCSNCVQASECRRCLSLCM